MRFTLTAGQEADINQAEGLVGACGKTKAVVADRAYDCDRLVSLIESSGATAVIPPKKNRKFKRPFDAFVYRSRNVIERLIGRLKQFRRIATRYDKTTSSFSSFLQASCIFLLAPK